MKYIYILLAAICLIVNTVMAYDPQFHTWDVNSSNHTIGDTVMFDDAGIKIFYKKGYVYLQNNSQEDVYFKFGNRTFNGMEFQAYAPRSYRIDEYTNVNIVESGKEAIWEISPILDYSVYNTFTSRLRYEYQGLLDAATLFYSLKVGDGDTHLNSHTFVANTYDEDHFSVFTEHKLADVNENGFDGSIYQFENGGSIILLMLNRTDKIFSFSTNWCVNGEPATFNVQNNGGAILLPYTARVITFPYSQESSRTDSKVTCQILVDEMDAEYILMDNHVEFEITPWMWLTE